MPTALNVPKAPRKVTRALLPTLPLRWYLCPCCNARVPQWGSQDKKGGPVHCRVPAAVCVLVEDEHPAKYVECGCGSWYTPFTGRTGHPKRHCSDLCKEFTSALAVLDRFCEKVGPRMTPDRWLLVRRRVFGAVSRRPWNLGVTAGEV